MILDNVLRHHAKMIRQSVERIKGLTLKFPPSATPEISAIEILERDQVQGARCIVRQFERVE